MEVNALRDVASDGRGETYDERAIDARRTYGDGGVRIRRHSTCEWLGRRHNTCYDFSGAHAFKLG